MSGLYNVLFGMNSAADVILKTLGLTREDVPRFRDAYVDGEKIVVHTRMGGGNKPCWDNDGHYKQTDGTCICPACKANIILRDHFCYLYDEDDSFDSTYADFYFSFPEEYAEDLKQLHDPAQMKSSEKWQTLFASMKHES